MSDFWSSSAAPAMITGVVSLLTFAGGSIVTLVLTKQKDTRDFKLELQVEKVLRSLLQHEEWTVRSMQTIRGSLPGLSEDELRRALIKVGAVSTMIDGKEVWGLMSRNPDLVNFPQVTGELAKRLMPLTINGCQQQQQQQQQQMQQQQQEDRSFGHSTRPQMQQQQIREYSWEDQAYINKLEIFLCRNFDFDLQIRTVQIG